MKKLLLIVAVLALAGCANLKLEWKASYKTDNLIGDLTTARGGSGDENLRIGK